MSCCLDVNDEGENRGGIVSISGIISPSFPSLGDWRTWSQTRLFQAVSITHRREEERRVSLKINTFPDKCHNLNELQRTHLCRPDAPIPGGHIWQDKSKLRASGSDTTGAQRVLKLVKAGGTDGTAASCLVPVQYAPPSWKRVWSCAHQPDPPGESQSHKPIEKLILILLNTPQSLTRLVFHDQNS